MSRPAGHYESSHPDVLQSPKNLERESREGTKKQTARQVSDQAVNFYFSQKPYIGVPSRKLGRQGKFI